ncbi:hypothetical protein CHS0354_035019 [Potamilus streckersoni]|uniref:Carboxylesterase type B domain-containing protein n=1 Tax=Potamilus streckersoni TaxID=2493646 RepID=A0AAE0SDQ1_9BIVA|nr:hypothetical protein CHS0354_035019 [Potamilus streckersoni]
MLHHREGYVCLSFLCYIINCYASVIIRQLGETIVETRSGRVRGVLVEFQEKYHLRAIEAFYNIPCASLKGLHGKELRFMPPSSPPRWKYLRNASLQNMSTVCPQKKWNKSDLNWTIPKEVMRQLLKLTESIKIQEEDCLNINIFVPGTVEDARDMMVTKLLRRHCEDENSK